MAKDYILYQLGEFYKTSEEITTGEPIFKEITSNELLAFKDINEMTNLERIYFSYRGFEQETRRNAILARLTQRSINSQ